MVKAGESAVITPRAPGGG